MTAPIIALGLKIQFESWEFTPIELISTCHQALLSAKKQVPCLVILDTQLKESEIDCFVLAQVLQIADHPVPIIFMDKTLEKHFLQVKQLKENLSYPHAWVNNPCHPEPLWQEVNYLLNVA